MRHIGAIRNRLGTAGFIVAIIALVAGLGGGAMAATKGLTAKEKKQVKAIAKRLVKPGTAGSAGPAGPPGPAGPVGPAGPAGLKGNAGAAGAQGPIGPTGPEGPSGPTGTTGATGATGSPWTADGLLPSTATLTGVWGPEDPVGGGFPGTLAKDGKYLTSVSFELPLQTAPQFVFVPGTEAGYGANAGQGCPGVTGGLPQADSGKFCVYSSADYGFATDPTVEVVNPDLLGAGPTRTGALVNVSCNATEGSCVAAGLWAVHGN